MRELSVHALGSSINAFIDNDAPGAVQALATLPRWLARIDATLSRFRKDSELSRLNERRSTVDASDGLIAAVSVALAAARETDGLVTPTVLPALLDAGYACTFEPNDAGVHAAEDRAVGAVPDWRDVELDREAHAIRLPPGVSLDVGGTAKGAWADAAARTLERAGPALVDAGGDVAVSGPRRDGTPWPVGIADPREPEELLEVIAVVSGGVATSGRDYRTWRVRGGRSAHHVIDPRTGAPAQSDVLAATIVGPSALDAEIAAKVVCILGTADGLAYIDARAALAALVVRDDGRVVASRRFGAHVWMEAA